MTDTRPVSSGELMQVLKRESMLWRLRITTNDDLWSLARLARRGMSIGMLGERRDQTTGGGRVVGLRLLKERKCGYD